MVWASKSVSATEVSSPGEDINYHQASSNALRAVPDFRLEEVHFSQDRCHLLFYIP